MIVPVAITPEKVIAFVTFALTPVVSDTPFRRSTIALKPLVASSVPVISWNLYQLGKPSIPLSSMLTVLADNVPELL